VEAIEAGFLEGSALDPLAFEGLAFVVPLPAPCGEAGQGGRSAGVVALGVVVF
jgi:hypothetical protein